MKKTIYILATIITLIYLLSPLEKYSNSYKLYKIAKADSIFCDIFEKPEIIYKELPIIPDSLKNIRSTVVVYVVVDTVGRVSKAGLFSCIDSIFIDYAVESAYKCKFIPGKLNGKVQPLKTLIKYDF